LSNSAGDRASCEDGPESFEVRSSREVVYGEGTYIYLRRRDPRGRLAEGCWSPL